LADACEQGTEIFQSAARLGFGCFIFSQCAVIAARVLGKKNKFSGVDALGEKFTFRVELAPIVFMIGLNKELH
jgi:hypothetical protein